MREVIKLNQNWNYVKTFDEQFIKGDFSGYDVQTVRLPHANQELPYNYFDEKDYQFISTYQRKFLIPLGKKGQKVFIDFEGVMTYGEVYCNGTFVGSHKGGYTPFSCDLTEVVQFGEENTIVVKVDSTERDDIPPFGNVIDYLCYGGIYRDVYLRFVNPVFVENIFAKPQHVLQKQKQLETTVYLRNSTDDECVVKVHVELTRDGEVIKTASDEVELNPAELTAVDVLMKDIENIELWSIDEPNLYYVTVKVKQDGQLIDTFTTRIGFREAVVKEDGFYLNGERLKIRGLNRHQSWPYVGYAMPERVQKRDADILKYELNLNTVRTSHYPQSKHFLNRCDEIGLLVIEEIPGWQHIGDDGWKKVACANVREMITRDWNHPSIFLWGVRINESPDDHEFYTETNRIARELDPTRQTGGIRCHWGSEFLEDVYTMNDFTHSGGELVLRDQKTVTQLDHYVPYIVTEYNGHMYPTKRFDHEERLMEHALRHMRVLSAAGDDPHIAGTIGWCAFDYNTHYEFGSGDRICYHGVMDMFRIPKFAAYAYSSQISPDRSLVLEPVTLWARGERSIGGVFPLVIFTNCDSVEIKVAGESLGHFYPDHENFSGVEYPPIVIRDTPPIFGEWGCHWYEGEFVGYVQGKAAAVKRFVKNPVPTTLSIEADDQVLEADGQDATRVVFKMLDQAGNILPYINDFVKITVQGPGQIIGPQEVALIGGCIATWIRTTGEPGTIRVQAASTRLVSEKIAVDAIEEGRYDGK